MHKTLTQSETSVYFMSAGAGVEFIRRLWQAPGSSRYLVGTSLLQAREEIDREIGYHPEGSYCSEEVAIELAVAAFLHAARVSCGDGGALGLAMSAAVASDRLPRGEQRAHLCLISERASFHRFIRLEKGLGEEARRCHDELLAEGLEDLIMEHFDVAQSLSGAIVGLEASLRRRPCFLPDGRREPAPVGEGLLFPATFNPVHEGHWATCEAAELRLGMRAELNIEASPPNKSPIAIPEMLRRIARVQVEGAQRIGGGRTITVTSGQATYLEKARKRPGSGFIVGADAVIRLLDPRWGNSIAEMLAEFQELGTQFYVRARRIGTCIVGLDRIEIPDGFGAMFHRLDGYSEISSSQLRARERCQAS